MGLVALVSLLNIDRPLEAGQADEIRGLVEADIARELMEPGTYPEAQFGMQVERAGQNGEDGLTVLATGAEINVHFAESEITCRQRLGQERETATILLPEGCLKEAKVVSQTGGAVILEAEGGRLRINGDSLLMFAPQQPAEVQVHLHFVPEWNVNCGANWLKLDNYGGLGVYVMGRPLHPTDPGGNPLCLELQPPEVLWVSIAPPRPFHWEQSFQDRYFSYWTPREAEAYPEEEGLREWLRVTRMSVLLLQSEVMLWKDWQWAFVPRRGEAELERVLEAAHELGVRVMVYTSPFYFTRGTPAERLATNDFPGGRIRFGPGWPYGDNLPLFLSEIRKVVQDYGVDGLYFDGIYSESLVQSYRLVRETRHLLGEERRLMLHTTWGPPGNSMVVFCPTIDAYADAIYRGEDIAVLATHTNYLRYMVSGYHVSNAIGMPCHNKVPPEQLNEQFINTVLDFNGRFFYHGSLAEPIRQVYWPALNEGLKERVERVMAERNAALQQRAAEGEEKQRELAHAGR